MLRALAVVAVLVAPIAAGAQCRSASSCICTESRTLSIAELRIASLDGPRTHATVVSLQSNFDAGLVVDGGAFLPGSALDLPRVDSDSPGSTSLAFIEGGAIENRVPVESDGKVKCPSADPNFRVAKDAAIDAALSSDCEGKLQAQGFQEPACHDTGVAGCSCGAGAGPAPLALLLGLWAARRRGRRARALLAMLGATMGCSGVPGSTCREPVGQQQVFARRSSPGSTLSGRPLCVESFSGTATFQGTGTSELNLDDLGHLTCSVSGGGAGSNRCFMNLNCGPLVLFGSFQTDSKVVSGSAHLEGSSDGGCAADYRWSMTR